MNKKWTIFCAEYLVLGEGILFVLCVLQEESFLQRLESGISGVLLLIAALTFAKILKRIVHKNRPLKKTKFFTPFDRYAFPSAHAASLFALTAFMLSQSILIGTVAFIITILIVVARVEAHVHDYIDIAGGFILGVSVTYYCMSYVEAYFTPYLISVLRIIT